METNSSIFTWETPWIEVLGGLQSMGKQKNWTKLSDETTSPELNEPIP